MSAQQEQKQNDPLQEEMDAYDDEVKSETIRLEAEKDQERETAEKEEKKKNLRKTLILAAAGACIGTAIHAAFVDLGSSTRSYNNLLTEKEEQPEYTEEQAANAYKLMNNATFTIDSQKYDWDSTWKDFEDEGWYIKEEDQAKLSGNIAPDDTVRFTAKKQGYNLDDIGFENKTESTISLEDAMLDHIYVYDKDVKKTAPLGIKIGMSMDDAKKILDENKLVYSTRHSSYSDNYTVDMGGEVDDKYFSMDYSISADPDSQKVDSIYCYFNGGNGSKVVSFN